MTFRDIPSPGEPVYKAGSPAGSLRENPVSMNEENMKITSLSVFLAVLLLASACTPAAAPALANSFQGFVWQWTSLTDSSKDRQPLSLNQRITPFPSLRTAMLRGRLIAIILAVPIHR
jgi:hypothetical protein